MNNKRLDNDNRSLKPPPHTIPGIELGERIMKSKDFLEHKYDTLNFQGKWGEFFGNPSVNFRCAISGMAGNGKTTFAIQFAKYLATNHGSVVYISSEEGFSKTLKDKITIEGSASDNLFIADLKTAEEIKATIKPEMFNFIFLDSLDNMHIDANELNKLRQFYINSALITISQSTKDGKMRGSYQIVHDSDIEIEVLNLEAVTKKNRFNEKNIKLSVIQKADVSFQGPRNTISK
jgi:predicted ATP-dependent serine protease